MKALFKKPVLILLFPLYAFANDVYVVTSTADFAGADGVVGTLRWALYVANRGPIGTTPPPCPSPYSSCEYDPDLDTVKFNIPGPGPHVITFAQNVTQSHWPVYIDGFSQPGSSIGNPKIVINGSTNDGFNFTNNNYGNASGSTVRGIIFSQVSSFALYLEGVKDILVDYVWIGIDQNGAAVQGTLNSKCIASNSPMVTTWGRLDNIIIRNSIFCSADLYGIELTRAINVKVYNNHIGTGITGNENTSGASGYGNGSAGINMYRCSNVEIYDNVIGNNGLTRFNSTNGNGITIQESPNNKIYRNKIGVGKNGTTSMPNTFNGISIWGSSNGSGEDAGYKASTNNIIQGNQISYNANYGIEVTNASSTGNIIGYDYALSSSLSPSATKPNEISYNGNSGIYVGACCGGSHASGSARYTTFRGNSIYCNDATNKRQINIYDSNPDGNDGLAAPVINTSTSTISNLYGTAPANKIIDVYLMNPSCGVCVATTPSKSDGYIWYTRTTSDGAGNWSVSGPFSGMVSATATDNGGTYTSNTSEFSTCFNTNIPLPVSTINANAFKRNLQSNEIDWTSTENKWVSHFEIEKSQNGEHFYAIGRIKNATGNSVCFNAFLDEEIQSGISYYRINKILKSGEVESSNIVSVKNKLDAPVITPNPYTSTFEVIYPEAVLRSNLYNLHGELLQSSDQGTVDGAGLNPGMYFMEFISNGNREVVKIVKQ